MFPLTAIWIASEDTQRLNLISDSKLTSSVTRTSMCILTHTANFVASKASKWSQRSHLTSNLSSVASIIHIASSLEPLVQYWQKFGTGNLLHLLLHLTTIIHWLARSPVSTRRKYARKPGYLLTSLKSQDIYWLHSKARIFIDFTQKPGYLLTSLTIRGNVQMTSVLWGEGG